MNKTTQFFGIFWLGACVLATFLWNQFAVLVLVFGFPISLIASIPICVINRSKRNVEQSLLAFAVYALGQTYLFFNWNVALGSQVTIVSMLGFNFLMLLIVFPQIYAIVALINVDTAQNTLNNFSASQEKSKRIPSSQDLFKEKKIFDNLEAKDSLIPPQDKNLVSLREFGQLQPEEMVVKYVLNILCNDLGFNPDDIDTEFPIQMGISNKRADIVVFRDKMPHTISNAYIIIECKRADKMHKEQHINQLKSYMAASPNVRYGVLASTNWRVWEMIITHRGRVYNEIDTLPDANNENTEFIYQPPTPDTLYEHKNNI